MGLRDTLFGRTKQAAPNLDNLFALSTAALTLESELDLVPSGHGGLCFKAGSGEGTLTTDADIKELLNFDETNNKVTLTKDDLGFEWLLVADPDLESLVTRIHSADTSMVEHGLGARLLCAVFGFVPKTPPGEGSLRLVYLLKQGTFYPFAPTGHEQRSTEEEFRIRSLVADDLKVEPDLDRWFPLWDLPVG